MMEEERVAREITARAIRRLEVLTWLTLLAAALMAMVGGAITAYLLNELLAFAFRPTWVISSLLLFLVPALVVFAREHRDQSRTLRDGVAGNQKDTDGR